MKIYLSEILNKESPLTVQDDLFLNVNFVDLDLIVGMTMNELDNRLFPFRLEVDLLP